eukprot:21344-Heterococcus_DN1.PRE.2
MAASREQHSCRAAVLGLMMRTISARDPWVTAAACMRKTAFANLLSEGCSTAARSCAAASRMIHLVCEAVLLCCVRRALLCYARMHAKHCACLSSSNSRYCISTARPLCAHRHFEPTL